MATSRTKKDASRKGGEKKSASGFSDSVKLGLIGLIALIVIAGGVVGALAVTGSDETTVIAKDSPEVQSEGSEATDNPKPNDRQAVKNYLKDNGFSSGDYTFGVTSDTPIERGNDAVASQPLLVIEDVVEFLSSGASAARQVRARIRACLDDKDYQRALNGNGYSRIQFQVPVVYRGNTYIRNGAVTYTTEPRHVDAGDIVFIFVGHDGKVKQCANIRSDCGNFSAVPTKPGQPGVPGKPPAPPTPPKPPEKCPPGSNRPECKPPPPPPQPECPYAPGCKGDTPSNTPGPTGNGKPQPVEDTEPAGGTGPDNAPPPQGQSKPHNPPPVPPPPSNTSPPAGNGGTTPKPTDNW